MRVLVTGASGMLGGAVARSLAHRGDDVTVFQRHTAGGTTAEILGSVTDSAAVTAAVTGQDAVIHLAAKVSITGGWSEFEDANVTGTQTLLREARHAGVSRFVHISSPSVAHGGSSLVGAGAGPADPQSARSHYARSKAMAERLALAADDDDFAVAVIRPHLVWGPGDTQLIGRIIQRAQAGRLAVVDQGAALIDTTYLDNAADAILAALDRVWLAHGQPLVVSNGQPRPVADLVRSICAAAGITTQPRRVPYPVAHAAGALAELTWSMTNRKDEPPMTRFLAEQLGTAHWFDQRQTRELLDWQPKISLDEGFVRLAAWFETSSSTAAGHVDERSPTSL